MAFFPRAHREPTWCAWLLGSAILLRELRPFYFLSVPRPFSWIPFAATLESGRDSAVIMIARKAFDYGAMVFALRCARLAWLRAGFAVALPLAATEAIQTYLPGRSPEITDPLLALLMTVDTDESRSAKGGLVAMNGRWLAVVFFAALVLATRLPLAPGQLFTFDDVNLAYSIGHFDIRISQPQPPGYPLFVMEMRALSWLRFRRRGKHFAHARVGREA